VHFASSGSNQRRILAKLWHGLVGQCERGALAQKTDIVVVLPRDVGDMNKTRFSKAETRILE
jgi:hypothetical protein